LQLTRLKLDTKKKIPTQIHSSGRALHMSVSVPC
jgi:hypothetical protein